jgi:hypothetical protein
MPTLRYVVAGEGARTQNEDLGSVRLVVPRDGDTLGLSQAFSVMWMPGAASEPEFYRVDFEAVGGAPLLSALLPGSARVYEAPGWLANRAGSAGLRWRVTALAADGGHAQASGWRSVQFAATLPSRRTSGTSSRPPR